MPSVTTRDIKALADTCGVRWLLGAEQLGGPGETSPLFNSGQITKMPQIHTLPYKKPIMFGGTIYWTIGFSSLNFYVDDDESVFMARSEIARTPAAQLAEMLAVSGMKRICGIVGGSLNGLAR